MSRIYKIEIPKSVEKALGKLPTHIREQIERRIEKLAEEPRPTGCEKLAGEDSLYRVRQGDYRVIYEIHDKVLVVLIIKIGHRRDVYRKR